MPASHQNIRLDRGKHAAPEEGACVMELASMLAGERFSDSPRAVCPVLATVLRGYNDGIDDVRRQHLYRYAAAAVGTRDRRARRRHAEVFMRFFAGRALRLPRLFTYSRLRVLGIAARDYARSADDEAHRRFCELLDELTGAAPITRGSASAMSHV